MIAPYKELLEIENIGENVLKVYGNLYEGLEKAKEFEKLGGKIVISRGGTAKLIKEYTDLEVIEIEVSTYEIIKALENIKNKEEPLGIVGYRNAVHKCGYIAKILNYKNIYELFHDDEKNLEEYTNKLEELIYEKKVKNFIGDVVLKTALERKVYYINYYLIKTEYSSVFRAVDKANVILKHISIEREKREIFKEILNNISKNLILLDKNNKIIEKIIISEELKNIKLDKYLKELISNMEMKNSIIINIENKDFLWDIKKIFKNEENYILFQIEEIKNKKILEEGTNLKYDWYNFLTQDKKLLEHLEFAKLVAKTEENIIIYGESGTGKEIIAQSIHNSSERKDRAFIALNCSSISESLIESELFGYEEGAFTGAKKRGKKGVFELANEGTLFLDELSELSYTAQAKILRALEEQEIRRVGAEKTIKVDVRIIAATNKKIRDLIEEKKFREDLYYRLNTFEIDIPPLRERKEDIIYIGKNILNTYRTLQKEYNYILNFLLNMEFRGNVRELKSILKKYLLYKEKLSYSDEKIIEIISNSKNTNLINRDKIKNKIDKNITFREIQAEIISEILIEEKGNKSRVARRLNIDRQTIDRILKAIKK